MQVCWRCRCSAGGTARRRRRGMPSTASGFSSTRTRSSSGTLRSSRSFASSAWPGSSSTSIRVLRTRSPPDSSSPSPSCATPSSVRPSQPAASEPCRRSRLWLRPPRFSTGSCCLWRAFRSRPGPTRRRLSSGLSSPSTSSSSSRSSTDSCAPAGPTSSSSGASYASAAAPDLASTQSLSSSISMAQLHTPSPSLLLPCLRFPPPPTRRSLSRTSQICSMHTPLSSAGSRSLLTRACPPRTTTSHLTQPPLHQATARLDRRAGRASSSIKSERSVSWTQTRARPKLLCIMACLSRRATRKLHLTPPTWSQQRTRTSCQRSPGFRRAT
mmetsp:Transcript_42777/g.100554  ORF Transcript_42777/g.100554 Transcript_42777/m.100554 type:complete len:327 (+) Transcript_42777:1217-2197(+)